MEDDILKDEVDDLDEDIVSDKKVNPLDEAESLEDLEEEEDEEDEPFDDVNPL